MSAPAIADRAASEPARRGGSGHVSLLLRDGVDFLLDGEPRTVQRDGVSTVAGVPVLALRCPDGTTEYVPVQDLIFTRTVTLPRAADTAPARGTAPVGHAGIHDLTPKQVERLQVRLAHALEAETGYRSGDPEVALEGEPFPQYDPALVPSVSQRRRNKADELRRAARVIGDPDAGSDTRDLSARTLQRIALTWYEHHSLAALLDHRHVRPRVGRQVSENVRRVIVEVEEDFAGKSRVSKQTKHRRVRYLLATYGVPQAQWPSYMTYLRCLDDWFGPNGARMKYQRTNAALPDPGQPVVPTRPGEVVFLDTNSWDVLVRDGVFGLPMEAKLTLALDVYTRSVVGFRFTLVSDKSVDVAMVLRDVMMPMPMRPEWGETAEWPYPGVPGHVVAEHAGYDVAGKPFLSPETITTDHGSVYANHHLVELTARTGCNFLPARRMRARDKHACENAFRVIRQLLSEHLPGWRGQDVADRGADPEGDACLTLDQCESYLAWFVVNIWQRRELGEHRPGWAPDGPQSPNSLFALSMAQGGWSMQIPDRDLYFELLGTMPVRLTRRGVLVKGLWYRGPFLQGLPLRSARGGQHGTKYAIKWDPRDRREVFMQDFETGQWHTLRWTGLPPEGEFPGFNDATAQAVLEVARERRLAPQADADLPPLFHEFYQRVEREVAGEDKGRAARRAAAREDAQASAAERDRPPVSTRRADAPAGRHEREQGNTDERTGEVLPFTRARTADEAWQSHARTDREQHSPVPPSPPLTLREARRRARARDEEE